jgi:hypothetical protein
MGSSRSRSPCERPREEGPSTMTACAKALRWEEQQGLLCWGSRSNGAERAMGLGKEAATSRHCA